MMPGANGLEVLKETRKIDPDILVILITGFASIETAIQAIREGAYDYITKPFGIEEIKILVNNAREKIRLINENKRLFHELQEAYKQLHMMKTISANSSASEEETSGPFIAGSMLPLYYSENRATVDSPILSGLERLSILKEKGILTEEEFNLCKSKIFKNIRH